jgi:uncharacterized membrane protein required for colicin V production
MIKRRRKKKRQKHLSMIVSRMVIFKNKRSLLQSLHYTLILKKISKLNQLMKKSTLHHRTKMTTSLMINNRTRKL